MDLIDSFRHRFLVPRTSPERTICENRWTYPVVLLSRGEFRFCCRSRSRRISEEELQREGKRVFLNSDYDRARRLEMLKGFRHSDCGVCWRIEDDGIKSPRLCMPDFAKKQRWETPMPLGKWREIARRVDSTPEWLNSNMPIMLEVMLGNTCDMKCLYCNHHYSSKWAQESLAHGDLRREEMEEELPKPAPSFEKLFWQSVGDIIYRIAQLNLIGGEPLITEKLYEFLDRWDAAWRARHDSAWRQGPILSLVTNLNCTDAQLDRFIEKFRSFEDRYELEFNVSMESFGERAEVIRSGLNWDRWMRNLRKVVAAKLTKRGISMQMATNALSVTSLLPLLKMVKALSDEFDVPIQLRQNVVSAPLAMAPRILTPDFASYLDECIAYVREVQWEMNRFHFEPWARWDAYASFLESIRDGIASGQPDPEHQRLFHEMRIKMERRRGVDFGRIFPEYAKFFDLCASRA